MTYLIKRGGTPPSWMLLSVLLNILESNHGGDVVVHCHGVLPQFLYCSGVVLVPFLLLFQESSMFCFCILDVEEECCRYG